MKPATRQEVERTARITQPSRRVAVAESPSSDIGSLGDEKLVQRPDGNYDLTKKLGDKWVKMQHELLSAVVSPDGIVVTINGKRFRAALEPID